MQQVLVVKARAYGSYADSITLNASTVVRNEVAKKLTFQALLLSIPYKAGLCTVLPRKAGT